MVYILRNGNSYGPYPEQAVLQYVNMGQILLSDTVQICGTGETLTVRALLRRCNLTYSIATRGSILEQFGYILHNVLVPRESLSRHSWLSDKRMIILALVGLTPTFLMLCEPTGGILFYLIALYFSAIWGVFFYYFFRTKQVTLLTTLVTFFSVQALMFLIWEVLGLPSLNFFYKFTESDNFILQLIGYIFGVGFTEELVKALPLFVIAACAKRPVLPQTLVFYGLMSGIGFGVYEGVQYQMNVNIGLTYDLAFFMNIARLTSLPFIHAIWCGIAGYFIAFAKLTPLYRQGLYITAIALPAVLHGIYDTLCGVPHGLFVALPILLVCIFLLLTYLRESTIYQQQLK